MPRSFRLDAELDAKLVAKAKKLDRSVSWVIARSIEVAVLGENEALGRAITRGSEGGLEPPQPG
jgi:predicted transcriptional regulator